jgi:hypothetical protein
MAKHSEYFVEPHESGGWAVRLPHAERASAVVGTQQKAIARAKEFARDGKFRRV